MNKLLVLIIAIFATIVIFGFTADSAEAAVRVGGYYRSSGTYVQPSYRSSPNRTRFDNYSTRGNVNPYTGSRGYTNPYRRY